MFSIESIAVNRPKSIRIIESQRLAPVSIEKTVGEGARKR